MNNVSRTLFCVDLKTRQLLAERETILEDQEATRLAREELVKEKEANFRFHKERIRTLCDNGVSPERICKEFESCGVALDLQRLQDYSERGTLRFCFFVLGIVVCAIAGPWTGMSFVGQIAIVAYAIAIALGCKWWLRQP